MGAEYPLTTKKIAKNRGKKRGKFRKLSEKLEKNQGKRGKIGKTKIRKVLSLCPGVIVLGLPKGSPILKILTIFSLIPD